MAAKVGSADRSGYRKSITELSNKEIVKKSTFRPKHWHKIEPELKKRGLVWEV